MAFSYSLILKSCNPQLQIYCTKYIIASPQPHTSPSLFVIILTAHFTVFVRDYISKLQTWIIFYFLVMSNGNYPHIKWMLYKMLFHSKFLVERVVEIRFYWLLELGSVTHIVFAERFTTSITWEVIFQIVCTILFTWELLFHVTFTMLIIY